MTREERYMQEAVLDGLEGMRSDKGGPFGCVIVKGEEIVGRGCNRVLESNDPTAHAEVVAIREARKNLQSFQLEGCELYTCCDHAQCASAEFTGRGRQRFTMPAAGKKLQPLVLMTHLFTMKWNCR